MQYASPVGELYTATSYLLPAVCGGVGQLISMRIRVLPSLSWFLRSLLLCVAVTALFWGTAVAQWLRCCATNRKVAGSIPAGVSGFYIDIKSFLPLYDPGVDSASERNEYQEYFLGVKAAGA